MVEINMLSVEQRTLMALILQKKISDALAHLKANPTMDINFSVSMPRQNLYQFTPLMMAANLAQENVVSALMKRNANVAATDLTGKTALHYAVGTNTMTRTRSQIIESLTDASKDLLTTADLFGNLPIHIAALNSAKERQNQTPLLDNPKTYTPRLTQNLTHRKTQVNNDSTAKAFNHSKIKV